MRQVTVTEKYRAVLEGNMAKGEFVRQMRLTHPQHITQFNGFDDSVQILKNRGLLFEIKKEVVEEAKEAEYAEDCLPYSDEAFQRGIRYELQSKGIEVHAGANIKLEDYDSAKSAAQTNLTKDPMHYLNLVSGESSKVDKHDKPSETKRGAKDVDTFNGLKKADLREAKTMLKEGKMDDLAEKLGIDVGRLQAAADRLREMEREDAAKTAGKVDAMKAIIDEEPDEVMNINRFGKEKEDHDSNYTKVKNETDGLSIDEHEHQFFHLAFEGKYDDILEDYMSSESYKQDEKEIQNKYDVSSAHDVKYLDEWENFIKEFEAINRDDATDTYNFEAKGIDEMLSISGNSEEEIKKNAEELLALAKKVGLDKAEIRYNDDGSVDGVELNDTVEDRNDGKTQKIADLQSKHYEASKAGRSKQEPSFKPKKLKKLTIGGKTYEKGDFDPNDDGRIMSIEKYPNGYFINGGIYSDYGDGDGPKEGYGYAIDLKGNKMDEEDLEGMHESAVKNENIDAFSDTIQVVGYPETVEDALKVIERYERDGHPVGREEAKEIIADMRDTDDDDFDRNITNLIAKAFVIKLKGVSEKKGKDHDGDGDVDGDDYMHAKDKAIKKAMGKEPQQEIDTSAAKASLAKFAAREKELDRQNPNRHKEAGAKAAAARDAARAAKKKGGNNTARFTSFYNKEEKLKEAIKKLVKESLLKEAATAKLSDIGDKYGDYKGMQVVINDLENIVTDMEGYFAKVRERVQSSMDKIGQIETPDGMKVGAFLAPAIESAFFRDLNPVRKLSARDISLPQVKTISSADIAAARAAGDIEEQPKQTMFGVNEKK